MVETITSSQAAPPVCLCNENSNRLDSLWWVMQQSDDPNRLASVVTLYLDESATDDASPMAVVGGLLLNKSGFSVLDSEWLSILAKYTIEPPLHIKDFRRPAGRLADVPNDVRRLLFADLAALINRCKLYSVAATLTTANYHRYFEPEFQKRGMSFYGTCFMLCAYMTHKLSEQNSYTQRIPILMDTGNPYAEHVRGAHAEMQEERWSGLNVGALTFDDDKLWTPLQAADVIAWASRVKGQSGSFHNGYEPLVDLFDEAHAQAEYPEKAMKEWFEGIEQLRRTTDFPL